MDKLLGLLPLALVIAVVWVFVLAFRRVARQYPPMPLSAKQAGGPIGVGGFLLFLVVGMIFLGPLGGFLKIYNEIADIERRTPAIRNMDAWTQLKVGTYWVHAVASGLSIWAGFGLLKDRRSTVVFRAIVVLWIVGPVMSAVSNQVLPYLTFGNMGSGPDVLASLFWSTAVTGIWTAYLVKSKRVRATYTEGSRPVPREPQLSPE